MFSIPRPMRQHLTIMYYHCCCCCYSSNYLIFCLLCFLLQISSNGIITLDTPDFLLFPVQLPIRVSFIAPFWSDVNTNIGGTVYFRDATSDTSLMQRVMAEVRMYFRSGVDYQPTYLFIATWDRVRFTGGSSNLVRILSSFAKCNSFAIQ